MSLFLLKRFGTVFLKLKKFFNCSLKIVGTDFLMFGLTIYFLNKGVTPS